jgi:hypothetical protein
VNLMPLIDRLAGLTPRLPVLTYCPDAPDIDGKGLANPHSYRGYYEQLALEPVSGTTDVQDVLRSLRRANGHTYEGWKGGSYRMGPDTPVHVAAKGSTGLFVAEVMPLDDRVLIVCAEEPW